MVTLTLNFKNVTPLFLGGVEPGNGAELRPPTIKGLLRYWYRAIDPNFAKRESRIFGGAGSRDGSSLFSLRMTQPLADNRPWVDGDYRTRPFQEGEGRGINGILYLGYSFNLGDNRRKSIEAGHRFTIILRATRTVSDEELQKALQAVIASRWLLGHLGAAGSRSRRGFGSLSLESWTSSEAGVAKLTGDGEVALPLAAGASTVEEWMERFLRGLSLIRSWFKPYTSSPDHAVIGPGTRLYLYRDGSSADESVAGKKRYAAWEHALRRVGGDLQKYRIDHRQSDHNLVRDHLIERSIRAKGKDRLPPLPADANPRLLQKNDMIQRAAFGLPLAFRFTSLDALNRRHRTPERFLVGTTFQGKDHDRSASPLLIRVVEIAGRCHPMVVLLRAPLLAPGEKLHEKGGKQPLALPSRAIVEDFCDSIVAPQAIGEVLR